MDQWSGKGFTFRLRNLATGMDWPSYVFQVKEYFYHFQQKQTNKCLQKNKERMTIHLYWHVEQLRNNRAGVGPNTTAHSISSPFWWHVVTLNYFLITVLNQCKGIKPSEIHTRVGPCLHTETRTDASSQSRRHMFSTFITTITAMYSHFQNIQYLPCSYSLKTSCKCPL